MLFFLGKKQSVFSGEKELCFLPAENAIFFSAEKSNPFFHGKKNEKCSIKRPKSHENPRKKLKF